jgi:hypothetical protein
MKDKVLQSMRVALIFCQCRPWRLAATKQMANSLDSK